MPLEQSLVVDEERWALTDWARKQMLEFRDRLLPKPQATVGKFTNATWLYVEGRRDSFPGFAHCDGHRWCQARATDVHANGTGQCEERIA